MEYEDYKVSVHSRDAHGEGADYCFCAIVMGWTGKAWCNTGIVVRDPNATVAFSRALSQAREKSWLV